jgi:hypothetical protein
MVHQDGVDYTVEVCNCLKQAIVCWNTLQFFKRDGTEN